VKPHPPVTEDQIRAVWLRERERYRWPSEWQAFQADRLAWRIAKLLAIQAAAYRERQAAAVAQGSARMPASAAQRPPVRRHPLGLDLKRLAGNDKDD
jgi:hypothetical protein